MADKIDDKGFLQRWSARKLDARADGDAYDVENADPPVKDEGDASKGGAAGDGASTGDPPVDDSQVLPPDLPDVETLDADSDFTAFLGDNVPRDVAKMALRKLWRSDPVLANLDGLNDYDEDFSKVGMVTEVVKTAYRVGKGLLRDDEKTIPDESLDETGGEGSSDADTQVSVDMESQVNNGDVASSELTQAAPSNGENDAAAFHDAEFIKPDE